MYMYICRGTLSEDCQTLFVRWYKNFSLFQVAPRCAMIFLFQNLPMHPLMFKHQFHKATADHPCVACRDVIVPAFPGTLLLSQWIATKAIPGKTGTNHIPEYACICESRICRIIVGGSVHTNGNCKLGIRHLKPTCTRFPCTLPSYTCTNGNTCPFSDVMGYSFRCT